MKDAYYFPHDANARHDQKVMAIRQKYGIRGYGIFFGVIEILREASGYQLPFNERSTLVEGLSYDLRESSTDVEDIILNYDLFEFENGFFYSQSLKNRMKELDEKRAKRSEAARLAGVASANARSTNVKRSSTIKVNKSKLDKTTQFVILHMQNSEFLKDWNDFLEMRLKIRRPATKRAQEAILKKLSSFDLVTARKILEQSIVNSWQDVFPLKTNSQPKQSNSPQQTVPSVDKTQEYLRSLET